MWCVSHFVAMVTGRKDTTTGYRSVVPWLAGLRASLVTGLRRHDTSGQRYPSLRSQSCALSEERRSPKATGKLTPSGLAESPWECAGAGCCGQCSNIWGPKTGLWPLIFLPRLIWPSAAARATFPPGLSIADGPTGRLDRTNTRRRGTNDQQQSERIFRYRLRQGKFVTRSYRHADRVLHYSNS